MGTTSETIDHVTLSHLVEAGAVHGANVIGQPGGWSIVIKYGMTERALAAKRGSVRTFRKFETLVTYLKGIGVAKYQVDAAGFDPVALKLTRNNEGAHLRLKAAHQAAALDKHIRQEVAEAIKEADDPNTAWVPHAEVKADMAQQRARIKAKIEAVKC